MNKVSEACKNVDVYPRVIKGPVLLSDPNYRGDFAEFKRSYEESDPCCCTKTWEPKHVVFGDLEIRGRVRFARSDGSKPTRWIEADSNPSSSCLEEASSFGERARALELSDDWEVPVFPKLPSMDSSPEREEEEPTTPRPSVEETIKTLATEGFAFLSYDESESSARSGEDGSLASWSSRRSALGPDFETIDDEGARGFFSRLVYRHASSLTKRAVVRVSGFLVARCVAKPGGAGYFRATVVVRKRKSNFGEGEPSSWKIYKTEILCLIKGSPSPNQTALEGLAVNRPLLLLLESDTEVSFEVHLHKVVPASCTSSCETSHPCVLALGDVTFEVVSQ